MPKYLQIQNDGQITLPESICRKAKLREGDLLKAVVEDDGSIRLVPKTAVDRNLAEQQQLKDIHWASKLRKETRKSGS